MREVRTPYTRCAFNVARRDITAPVGIYSRYWGAADHDAADGVHRPATATAAVIQPIDEGDGDRLVLVAVDYGSFHPLTDEKAIRTAVQGRNGLDESNLLISLSHCHAGANASTHRTDLPGGDKIPEYLTFLADQISDAVAEASASVSPAWITWGTGRCSLARNRDYWDAEAGEWGCGFNPLGEQDDTVLVGRVTDDAGKIQAVFFNYACHPTTLAWDNHLLSPDYIGAAREVIEQNYDASALFFQGASGELGPWEGYVGDTEVADRNGRQLGFAVASALEELPAPGTTYVFDRIVKSGADLATWKHVPASESDLAGATTLKATVQTVSLTPKEIPSADELRRQLEVATDRAEGERLKRRLVVRLDLGEGETFDMPIWVWRLGDAAVVAIPNEPYSILQTTLRAAFAPHPVMVLGVTNGSLGYLCPAEIYGSGRYQEKQSPFEAGCLERTIAAASEGLAGLFEPTSSPVR